jgi:hypothetical protein
MPSLIDLANQYEKKQAGSLKGTMTNKPSLVDLATSYEEQGIIPKVETAQPVKKESFLKETGKAIAKPIAELGVSAANEFEAFKKFVKGDYQGAAEALDKTRNLPFVGETKPAFTGKESTGEAVKKMVGYGLEVGSYLPFGQAIKGVGTAVKGAKVGEKLLPKIGTGALRGATEGGIGGTMIGAAQPLQENQGLGETLKGAVFGGLTGAAFGGALGATAPAVGSGARKVISPLTKKFEPLETKVSNAIKEGVDKGIKPSFAGRKTLAAQEKYYKKADEAIRTINEYKPTITTEDGLSVVRNPENRKELLDAIGQAKTKIYQEYNNASRQAGKQGITFNGNNTINELMRVSNDLSYSPQIRDYAKSFIPEISELRGQSPEIIEARMGELNESLANWFANRTDKVKARVDVSVANLMKSELDDIVENATGAEYEALKSKYGSLKEIEKDVGRQVMAEARKANKGLVDFTDVFTGGDLVGGVLSLNPAQIARGLAGRGIKEIYKYLNNPNRYIKKMFNSVGRYLPEKIKQGLPSKGITPITAAERLLPAPAPQLEATYGRTSGIVKELPNPLTREQITASKKAAGIYRPPEAYFGKERTLPKIEPQSSNLLGKRNAQYQTPKMTKRTIPNAPIKKEVKPRFKTTQKKTLPKEVAPKIVKVFRGEGGVAAGKEALYGKGTYFAEAKDVAQKYGKVRSENIDTSKYFDGLKPLPDDVLNDFAVKYSKKFNVPLKDVKDDIDMLKVILTSSDYKTLTMNMSKPKGIKVDYEKFESEVADTMNEVLKAKGYEGVKAVEFLNDKPTKNIIYNKFVSSVEKVSEELSPLLQEAKKYKSAEEFVKAQPTYYRGATTEQLGGFEGRGTFLTSDKKYADIFAGKEGKTFEYKVDPNKLKIQKSVAPMEEQVAKELWEFTDDLIERPQDFKNQIAELKTKGINALESFDGRQLLVLDNDLVKTKSQLTDIWNKANKK